MRKEIIIERISCHCLYLGLAEFAYVSGACFILVVVLLWSRSILFSNVIHHTHMLEILLNIIIVYLQTHSVPPQTHSTNYASISENNYLTTSPVSVPPPVSGYQNSHPYMSHQYGASQGINGWHSVHSGHGPQRAISPHNMMSQMTQGPTGHHHTNLRPQQAVNHQSPNGSGPVAPINVYSKQQQQHQSATPGTLKM